MLVNENIARVAAFAALSLVLLLDPAYSKPAFLKEPVVRIFMGLFLILVIIVEPISGLLLGMAFAVLVSYQHSALLSREEVPGKIAKPSVEPVDREEEADAVSVSTSSSSEVPFLSEYWLTKAQDNSAA